MYLLCSQAARYEAYVIHDTLDLCFHDTKTNKRNTTMTMTTDNANCNHDTVRRG